MFGLRERMAGIPDRTRFLARRSTASRRVLPDFLIIGAQKSGTAFLRMSLAQHPAITMAIKPEVHYFDWNSHRGIGWYRAHFPPRSARQRSLHRGEEFATGEKSPYYLFDPAVPVLVRAVLPEVKLIVLLRDPVARAFSHYQQATRRGQETLSFEDAVASELRQGERRCAPADPRGRSFDYNRRSYIARGRYAEQLDRWLCHFDREQIHVTVSERFFADPARAVCEIQQFVGLTPVVPENLRHSRRPYAPMSAALRLQLHEIFADDVGRLAKIIGEDPGWW